MRKLICLLLAFCSFFIAELYCQDAYDTYTIKDIRITIDDDVWQNKLKAYKKQKVKKRIYGTMKIDGVQYDSVGIRFKGNSSYASVNNSGSMKLPFNIKINHVKKKQNYKGIYTLKLSNVYRDPSFLREVMSYEIARKYMPAPKANFVKLYINDEYFGFYNNTESTDKHFLKKNFGDSDGTYFKCDPDWDATQPKECKKGSKASLLHLGKDSTCYYGYYELKSDYGWKDLIQLTDILNNKTEKIESVLNVDQVLWMLAYNNVLVNLDSYNGRLCHNYYLYKDSLGVFNPIPWDMNLSFGAFPFENDEAGLPLDKLHSLSPLSNFSNKSRPLISTLLKNKLYKKIYLAHIKTIVKDHFSNFSYKKRAMEIQRVIDYNVKNDDNKLYTYQGFKDNIEKTAEAGKSKIIGIAELMDDRTKYLQEHPLLKKPAPQISEVRHQQKEEKTLITARALEATNVYIYFRNVKAGKFTRKKMKDDGEQQDGKKGDNVFGILLDKKEKLHYYIVAESDGAASLSPEKSSFECYEIK